MRVMDIPALSGATRTGHLRDLRDDRFGLFRRLNAECGDLGRATILGIPLLFANGPEVLHEMLVEKARSFIKSPGMRGPLKPIAGQGLFTSEGDTKMVQWYQENGFHPQAMDSNAMPGALQSRCDGLFD